MHEFSKLTNKRSKKGKAFRLMTFSSEFVFALDFNNVYIRIDRNVECSEVQFFVSKPHRHQQREAEELLPWWNTNLSVPRL